MERYRYTNRLICKDLEGVDHGLYEDDTMGIQLYSYISNRPKDGFINL
jgi:hypothetical protein